MSLRNADGLSALTKSINTLGEGFDLHRAATEQRLADVQAENAALRDRLEELESRGSLPGRTGPSRERRLEGAHKDAFCAYLRNRQDPALAMKLRAAEEEWNATLPPERKDVSTVAGASGGFAVPEEILREIGRLEKKFSPVRNLVRVQPVGTSDFKALVNIRGSSATASAWVGEAGTRSATTTPQLREVTPTHGELYAYPTATAWSLDDIFFDVAGWLAEETAQEFAIQEGDAVIRGNGTTKPTGMLNSAPTAVADFASPPRAAAVYEFLASAASPDAILPDRLIDLVYAVNSAYRANATWTMNSLTAAAIRKLKDTTNQYLWQRSLIEGQPDLLLGYRVAIWEQMDNVGANTHPVAFGDFRRGYILTDRHGIRLLRDEVTAPGFVKFYIRRRVGGMPLDNHAIKFLKTT